MIKWVTPTEEQVNYVANNMRVSDVKEVWLSVGLTPIDALRTLVNASDITVCLVNNDEPVYIMGGSRISLLAHNIGYCWGLATTYCDIHKLLLAKVSLRGYDMLWNALGVDMLTCHVLEERSEILKWLKWVGATIGTEKVAGVNGGVFIPYIMKRR